MTTDQLIEMLARGVEPVAPYAWRSRYASALAWGVSGSAALMLLMLGVRPDLAAAAHLPMFWVKLSFPAAMLWCGIAVTSRLSRPGSRLGRLPAATATPVLAMWVLAAVSLLGTAPGEAGALVLGESASVCSFTIAILSVPLFVAVFWAAGGLAPTRPALTGAAAGLAAGAGGALVYALYCSEMAPAFLGIWYLLGMLIPAAVGAVLGTRLLRW